MLAEKSGIPREVAVDVLTHSVIGSPMVQYRGPFVLNMREEAWFDVNMMQKDMPAGARDGTPARRTAADHGARQRDADGGQSQWASYTPRFRDSSSDVLGTDVRGSARSAEVTTAMKKSGPIRRLASDRHCACTGRCRP